MAWCGVHDLLGNLDGELQSRGYWYRLDLYEVGLVAATSIAIGVLAGLVLFIALASYEVRQFRRVMAAVATVS
jgi:hypothetical protein